MDRLAGSRRRRRRLTGRLVTRAVIAVALAIALVRIGESLDRGRVSEPRSRPVPLHAVRVPRGRRFRWLVATTGPQPSIASENRAPGTSAWRLPGPAADVGGLAYGTVRGYVSAPAIRPGHVERLYVNAPGDRWVQIALFRMGWYHGRGGRAMLISRRLTLRRQPGCRHRARTGLTECDWHPTLSFRIPPALASGVYIARLQTASGASDCLFVVQSLAPQPLLAQLPTATYQAYNAWGGDSLYPGGADPVGLTQSNQGVAVSYDRPYDSVTGAGQFFTRDIAMVRFLERYGYPVSYTTSEALDRDPAQALGHRALIDFGHSEYWSARQADAFAAARRTGESLLFFSSDTLAWRVRYTAATAAASQAGGAGETLVAFKQRTTLDRSGAAPTGIFRDHGARLSGSAYEGCITPRLPVNGPPVYRYYPWRPAPGLRPRWLFAGTGLEPASEIPGIVGYELDHRTPSTPRGTRVVGSGTAPCMAGQREGDPRSQSGLGLAETTLWTGRHGQIVFDSGTLGWELGLSPVPSASPDVPAAPDPRVVAMTRNLLDHVLRRRPPG